MQRPPHRGRDECLHQFSQLSNRFPELIDLRLTCIPLDRGDRELLVDRGKFLPGE
jgi:hypothetical protein